MLGFKGNTLSRRSINR